MWPRGYGTKANGPHHGHLLPLTKGLHHGLRLFYGPESYSCTKCVNMVCTATTAVILPTPGHTYAAMAQGL